jgi:hypothetical protein
MSVFSRVLVCACVGALIAGCGSAPYRSGKGNDHLVQYRPANVDDTQKIKVVETRTVVPAQREVIYVQQPQVIYQPAPTYRVVTSKPDYTVVTTRPAPAPAPAYVPVTRYYYD